MSPSLLTPEDVRRFRESQGLTQQALADRTGYKLRTIEDWEAKRRKCPAALRLAFAAIVAGLDPWEG